MTKKNETSWLKKKPTEIPQNVMQRAKAHEKGLISGYFKHMSLGLTKNPTFMGKLSWHHTVAVNQNYSTHGKIAPKYPSFITSPNLW